MARDQPRPAPIGRERRHVSPSGGGGGSRAPFAWCIVGAVVHKTGRGGQCGRVGAGPGAGEGAGDSRGWGQEARVCPRSAPPRAAARAPRLGLTVPTCEMGITGLPLSPAPTPASAWANAVPRLRPSQRSPKPTCPGRIPNSQARASPSPCRAAAGRLCPALGLPGCLGLCPSFRRKVLGAGPDQGYKVLRDLSFPPGCCNQLPAWGAGKSVGIEAAPTH